MTTEVSTLGLKVDSSDVPRATAELDKLAAAGAKSERATDGLADMFKALNASMGGVASNTAEMTRQMTALNAANGQHAAALAQVVSRLDQVVVGQGAAAAAMRDGNAAAAGMANALEDIRGESASAAAGIKQLAASANAAQFNAAAASMAAVNTQIKQTATITPAAVAGINQANSAVKGLGVSSAQTAAAMRMLPAQMTDIVTQLAGGQNPFLILVQQGGQIKDSFGGLRPTFQALSGLITPLSAGLTIAGAAVAGLAVAYYQGSKEADEFNKQLILTGRIAGVTKDQLSDMAREVSKTVGTQGKAADVLAQLVATGKVAGDQMRDVTTSIIAMSDATGREVGEMVKEFSDLGKAPVEASRKLNEQYHYLSLAVYSQIQALKEQGREEEAAALAQRTYSAAMTSRAQEVVKDLGYIERAWKSIKEGAKGAWDAMLDIGRPDTLSEKLKKAKEELASMQSMRNFNDLIFGGGTNVSNQEKAKAAEVAALTAQIANGQKAARDLAERQRIQQAGISAASELDARRKALLKGEEKIQSELADMQKRYAAIRAADPNDPRLDPKAIAADEAAIRAANQGRGGDARRTAAATMSAELERIQAQAKTTAQALADAERMLQAVRAAGGLADDEYFTKKQRLIKQTADAQVKALNDENAALESQKATGAQQIENQGKIVVNLERIKQVTADALQAERILELQRAEAARTRAAAYQQARDAAEDQLASMQKALQREAAAVGMAEEAKKRATGRYSIDDRYEAEILAAERARKALQDADAKFPFDDGSKRWNEDAQSRYNERIKLVTEVRDREVKIWEDGYGQIKAAEMDWSRGAARAFEDYANNAAKAGNHAANFVTGGLQRAEDAIVKFAKTGKLSFGDLFSYMADEFLRQQARMVVSQATSSSGGGLLSVLGSIGGAIFGTSGLASAASAMPGDSLDNFLALAGNFSGRAIGGPVSAGRGYEILERGEPEVLSVGNKQILMMGKQAGTVTPLRQSLDAASGPRGGAKQGDTNVTLNMSFGSDVSVATMAAWGRQIRDQIKGEILYSKQTGGVYS